MQGEGVTEPQLTSKEQNLPHYPPHFVNGSVIRLADGGLKKVEELTAEDFLKSASLSGDLKVDASVVVNMTPVIGRGTVQLSFLVSSQKIQVTVESTLEHPFFVFGKGWSSYNPERTLQRYKLQCSQLQVGDQCVSLAKKDYSVPPSYNISPRSEANHST